MHPIRLAAALALATAAVALPCSAREITLRNRDSDGLARAIEAANADPSIDRIRLATGGLYTLRQPRPDALGLPAIAGRLTIDGRGAEIRRYAPAPMTLLEIADGATVTLRNVTLAEGSAGAIRNRGQLTLEHVTVTDSTGERLRGIVVNHGTLDARDCTFAFNRVEAGGRDIGTLVNHGTMRLVRTTIADNLASRRYPTLAAAGAVLNHGRLELDGVVIEHNVIGDQLGGLAFAAVVNLDGGSVAGRVLPGLVLDEVDRGR